MTQITKFHINLLEKNKSITENTNMELDNNLLKKKNTHEKIIVRLSFVV